MKALTKTDQDNLNPEQALSLLKEGNKRFLENKEVDRNLLGQVQDTSGGQYPFACVLGLSLIHI